MTREVLEVPAAGWAAESLEASKSDLLTSLLDAMEESGEVQNGEESGEVQEVRSLHVQFHLRIAEMAGNTFLLADYGRSARYVEKGAWNPLSRSLVAS